jgi:nitrite reductase (NADH) large subunit
MKQKLVVVGNGMAGARAAEEVLARARDRFDIVMFGAEPYGNYNRILLSNILSGAQDTSEIFINPLGWYEENGVKLHAGAPVQEIDRAAKVVQSENGVRETYDKLLIATGSRAFIPPMAGINGPHGKLKRGVFGFRTIDDCKAIVLKAKESRRAVVIGGGLLGLEAARGLLNHGCEVHVVHLAGHLMEMQLDPTGGSILRSSMQAMGVKVHLQKMTTEVLGEDRVTGLAFKDGSTLDCDMVVVSAGIKPNAEIGLRCGLSVERAIVVDNHMRSVSDPNVYVVGECAQHRGRVYGLVAPLWEQAKVFADHITGHKPDAAYHGSKLATKLKVMGVELASMGITEPAEERDEIIQFTEPRKGTYKKLIVRDGRLVGGILMGDISKAAYLMQCFDRDAPLPDERLSLLFDLGAPSQKVTIEEMPPEMQVCNCNGVSKAAIAACVAGGARSAAGVMDATRAGKGCGSCKSLVAEIVGWLCSREVGEDASAHAYVPAIPLRKTDLVAAIREKGLKSVSAVFREFAGGAEDAASEPALASLLAAIWGGEHVDERDARFDNSARHGSGKDQRTCKSCIGVDYCRFALGDSIGLAVKIQRRLRGVDTPGKLKLATAGCPRNCSEALIEDIGAVAIGDGKWEVYIGGTDAPHARKGHVLCIVDDEDDVLLYTGRFTQFYRENAKHRERTSAFVGRIGIARIRAVVVDDSEGIAAALDKAAMQASGAATYDPWEGAAVPKTPNQFASVITAAEG